MSEYHPKLQVVKKNVEVEVLVESASSPGACYLVKVSSDKDETEWTCTCKAFEMGRGDYCKHIATVKERLML